MLCMGIRTSVWQRTVSVNTKSEPAILISSGPGGGGGGRGGGERGLGGGGSYSVVYKFKHISRQTLKTFSVAL